MYSAIEDEPTKPRLDVLVIEDGVHRLLVAVDDIEDAGGRPPPGNLGDAIGNARVALEGLRMKALPQAMAGAHFHSGIIAGKLNGVMPATTPSGWRKE